MKLSFSNSIANKLGLNKDRHSEAESTGDLSLRDAALAKKRGGWRVQTEQPTGYARKIRRQRHRDTDSAQRKACRNAARTEMQRNDLLDTAGMIAAIYFGKVEASEAVYDMISERVDAQVEAIAAGEKIDLAHARQRVEQALQQSFEALEAAQSARLLDKQRRRAQSKRGQRDLAAGLNVLAHV